MSYKDKSVGLKIESTIRNKVDEKYEIIQELIKMCASNVDFYKADQSSVGVKLTSAFSKVAEMLEKSVPVIKEIESFAGLYDFDEKIQANGYRSFVYIFNCAVIHTEKICRYITESRASLLFRKSLYMKWVTQKSAATIDHWIHLQRNGGLQPNFWKSSSDLR